MKRKILKLIKIQYFQKVNNKLQIGKMIDCRIIYYIFGDLRKSSN